MRVAISLCVLGACGGTPAPAPTLNRGRGDPPPAQAAMVFIDWGADAVFEAACWAPPGQDCAELRQRAAQGGALVTASGRFRLSGRRADECGASGDVAEVVGVTREGGVGEPPGVGVFPSDAEVGFLRHGPGGGEPWMAAALASIARADAVTDDAGTITADRITIAQVVTGNFTGGPAPDQLILAHAAETDIRYLWSGMVLVPDGDRRRVKSLWASDLETMVVRASYDLDGDGVREFAWAAEYYEGASVGGARIVGETFEAGAVAACGA